MTLFKLNYIASVISIPIAKSVCVYGPADASDSHARCARDAVTQSFSEITFGKRYRALKETHKRNPGKQIYPLSKNIPITLVTCTWTMKCVARPESTFQTR